MYHPLLVLPTSPQAGYKLRNHAIVEQSLMRGVLKRMERQNLFQARCGERGVCLSRG